MPLKKQTLLTLTILAICSGSVTAQNCKHVVEKKDEFTNQLTRSAKIGISSECAVQLQHDSKSASMGFYIKKYGLINTKLMPGHKVLFKLEDGDIVELVLDKECPPNAQQTYGTTTVYTSWWFTVPVDDAFYQKFTKSPVTAIRTSIGANETTLSVKEKTGRALMDTFNCILQN